MKARHWGVYLFFIAAIAIVCISSLFGVALSLGLAMDTISEAQTGKAFLYLVLSAAVFMGGCWLLWSAPWAGENEQDF